MSYSDSHKAAIAPMMQYTDMHDRYLLRLISKKVILNKYLDYVEEKLEQGHDLSRMMKHLFGLSRGDKFAKSFRIKILEVIKKESIKPHRKELEDLLFY